MTEKANNSTKHPLMLTNVGRYKFQVTRREDGTLLVEKILSKDEKQVYVYGKGAKDGREAFEIFNAMVKEEYQLHLKEVVALDEAIHLAQETKEDAS